MNKNKQQNIDSKMDTSLDLVAMRPMPLNPSLVSPIRWQEEDPIAP